MGKEKKRVTKTHRSILKTYMGYMNRIRSEEPELGKILPTDKEVGTPKTLESFLFAAGVTGVLKIDEEAPFNEASYENYKTELQIQAELLKDVEQWPPAGFTLPAEKQAPEDEEEEQKEEREDAVLVSNEEEQSTREDEKPEPENQDEDKNGEKPEEEMTGTSVADVLAAEPKQEPFQTIESEPKPVESQAPRSTTAVAVVEPLVPAVQPEPTLVPSPVKPKENGKDKEDKDWQGNWIYGYIGVWHPKLGWGEINSFNQRTKRWEIYKVKIDDIQQGVLKVMEERIEVWDQEGRDPDNIYLSTYEYFETRLFVNFIPELHGREYTAKDVKIHEPSIRAEFATKNSLKLLESNLKEDLDAKIVSVKKEIGETIASTVRDEVKKAKDVPENVLKDRSTSGVVHAGLKKIEEDLREFRAEFNDAMIDIGNLKRYRDAEVERRNKKITVDPSLELSELKKIAENFEERLKNLEKIEVKVEPFPDKPDEAKPADKSSSKDSLEEGKIPEKTPLLTRQEKIWGSVAVGIIALSGFIIFMLS